MPQPSSKQRILDAIRDLPDDLTFEDAIERLRFLAKIQRGVEQLESGETISQADAKTRLLG